MFGFPRFIRECVNLSIHVCRENAIKIKNDNLVSIHSDVLTSVTAADSSTEMLNVHVRKRQDLVKNDFVQNLIYFRVKKKKRKERKLIRST